MINAYLFAWNAIKWPWPDIADSIKEIKQTGITAQPWTCASHRTVKPGDRAFLVKLGSEPKGVMGSGYVSSFPFQDVNYSGRQVKRVIVNFDILLNPETERVLPLPDLKQGVMAKQLWSPQASGIAIKPDVLPELEEVWREFLYNHNK